MFVDDDDGNDGRDGGKVIYSLLREHPPSSITADVDLH
jgi:hypothetical protein